MEIRFLHPNVLAPCLRDDDSLAGYAALYWDGANSTEQELWPGAVQRFAPDCFTLDKPIVAAAIGPDETHFIGISGGCLTVISDLDGLLYVLKRNPFDDWHDELFAEASYRPVGSVVGYRPTEINWTSEGSKLVRNVIKAEVCVVGVNYSGRDEIPAAYIEDARDEVRRWEASIKAKVLRNIERRAS